MNSLIVIGLLVVILAVLLMRNGSYFSSTVADKGNLIVYGSKSCPWCVKQENWLTKSGIDYTFVDCTKTQCPDFVQGFPTLLLNNEVMNGYTEIGPQLSYPSPVKTRLPF
jgi:hypothetical protein